MVHITNVLTEMYRIARNNNIKVVAVTLTPWKGYTSWTPLKQQYTKEINAFIMGSDVYATIDAYSALEDPLNPNTMRKKYQSDELHPNSIGHKVIAELILNALQGVENEY